MKKRIVILVIIILILLATFGVSVAIFSYATDNKRDSLTFNTANFKFKYTELTTVGNGINIVDADPVVDAEGKIGNDYFEFKIEADQVYEDFNYEVVLEEVGSSNIPHDIVKFYLAEVENNEEEGIAYSINEDNSVKVLNDYYDTKVINQKGKTVYTERIAKGTTGYEKVFRARVFIKDGIDITDTSYMNTETSFRINVFVLDNRNICEYSPNHVWDFEYTGNNQTFVVPCAGNYRIELWGASGGTGAFSSYTTMEEGGSGAYTSGTINLSDNDTLYIYVGEKGIDATAKNQHSTIAGGYNGGGNGVSGGTDDQASSAGGATDVRVVSGEWDNTNSLNSRIMVAAGGGGGHSYANSNVVARNVYPGINGQGLSFSGTIGQWQNGTRTTTVNQTSGGQFGVGTSHTNLEGTHGAGGGGGGWYGGTANTNNSGGPGSGGTSYISGHTGSVAVSAIGSNNAKDGCLTGTTDISCSLSPYEYQFEDTIMIDGAGYSWTNVKGDKDFMPNPEGGFYADGVGHRGNGYARITYLADANTRIEVQTQLVGRKIKINATGLDKIVGYSVTSFTNLNPAFINVEPTKNLTTKTNVLEPGNYYVWIKDENDNVVKKQVIISQNQSTCEYALGTEWTFDYDATPAEQTFTVPCDGYYKLEVWGAQGGKDSGTAGGFGGYSVGTIASEMDKTLYINVGGKGLGVVSNKGGGYNGGGNAGTSGASGAGGGATHIATRSGVLSSLADYVGNYVEENGTYDSDTILIVAGGGGGQGGGTNYAGSGGGYQGVTASGKGATQIIAGSGTSGGSFGQGGNRTGGDGGGGGGGFFGGGAATADATGGGGSGFIGSKMLMDKAMYCYGCVETNIKNLFTVKTNGTSEYRDSTNCPNGYSADPIAKCAKSNDGYAKITYIGEIKNDLDINVTVESNIAYIRGASTNKIVSYAVSTSIPAASDYISLNSNIIDNYYPIQTPGNYTVWLNLENGTVKRKTFTVDSNDLQCTYAVGQEFNFDYNGVDGPDGGVQAFIPKCAGNYQLEVWGAQGGKDTGTAGGYGGYSVGNALINAGEKIYIAVGGKGLGSVSNKGGGYNGGGNAGTSGASGAGGGATHMATQSGVLSSLADYKGDYSEETGTYNSDTILIVAGGGGGQGGGTNYAGSGGGYQGVTASGKPGTQAAGGTGTSAGSFGQGGNRTGGDGGGGGGGFFGGGAATSDATGSGGSGFIGSSRLTDKMMFCYNCAESSSQETFTVKTNGTSTLRNTATCSSGNNANPISKCAKSGNGYARITYLGN